MLNDEQRAELATFMDEWKAGYDASWQQLREENARLREALTAAGHHASELADQLDAAFAARRSEPAP